MEALEAGIVVFLLLALYLGLGVWVFAGLMLVGGTALVLLLDMPPDRVGNILKGTMWRSATTAELAAVPLFIWMGEIVFRSTIADRLFRGLAPWVDAIPGRLLYTSVGGCTIFAALSGSSAATTATMGKITMESLTERGYDRDLTLGSLAGAGTLGLMIPPSIVMIVYGVLAEVSITQLFAAGVLPGLLVAGLYSAYIAARCAIRPSLAPRSEERFTHRDRIKGIGEMLPVLLLITVVLGGIYAGLVTPSESAALGVLGALLLTGTLRRLTRALVVESLRAAVKTSCMVITIVAAASFMSSAIGYLHVPQDMARAIGSLGLGPYGLILLLGAFYLMLGLFLDGISILVMSLPITLPLVISQGFDPVWFGVFLVVMVELAQVTPPVGFNLFVLQGLTGHPIGTIARAALPFFLLLCVAGLLLTLFPQIALWLPGVLYGPG